MFQILILLCLIGVYKVARDIMKNYKHLTDSEILDYKHNRRSLSEPYQQRITNHIGTCEDCRKRFMDILMQ